MKDSLRLCEGQESPSMLWLHELRLCGSFESGRDFSLLQQISTDDLSPCIA